MNESPIFETIGLGRKLIDNTIGKELGEFEKIEESSRVEEGVFITEKNIVSMSDDEIIDKKIKSLKKKVALGKATNEEIEQLKLLCL